MRRTDRVEGLRELGPAIRGLMCAGILAVGLCATTGVAAAQDGETQQIPREVQPADVGQGESRAGSALSRAARGMTVQVVDREGPVVGATIELVKGDKKLTARTGPTGKALLDVRSNGRWDVTVSGDGYLPSKGFIPFPARSNVEIELRRTDEGTPAAVEGDSASEVRKWLERGETLLQQKQYQAARAELAKTLRHIEQADQAEVRVTMARAFWLEGERAKAMEELEEAIRLDSDAQAARQVYAGLMEALGRGAEVEARLATLAEEQPKSLEAQRQRQQIPQPNPKPATAHEVGTLELIFSESHPVDKETIWRRVDFPEPLRAQQTDIDLAQESFDVVVPEEYADRSSEERWGVFVWISPVSRGGVRNEAVKRLLADRKLIWVGANNSGNPRSYWQRIALALHGVHNAQLLWDIDPARVYVGGYSGGGRVSSMAAWLWPEVFRGAVFWMGTDYFEPLSVPYAPGQSWAPRFPEPSKSALRTVKKRSRFAFVTGDRDFNRIETNAIYRHVRAEGYERNTLIQIPDADHYYGIQPGPLGEALAAIEAEP